MIGHWLRLCFDKLGLSGYGRISQFTTSAQPEFFEGRAGVSLCVIDA